VIGLVVGPRAAQRAKAASAQSRLAVRRTQAPSAVRNDTPVPVVDFYTAIQDVQRVQRKAVRGKEELPNLKQDVRMMTDTLGAPKHNAADAMVAHYYRAVAMEIINAVHEHDGEPIDLPGARMARADLDKIIGAGRLLTYVPEITIPNAEYWAGSIARNQLHDEPAAYAYWEKCAWDTHGGCINNLASSHITGAGGEKVDFNKALELYTAAYNTGTKYHCAGAFSAASIANVNFFTGVRRAGDDEMEWMSKANALLDTLETKENNRNVCHRSEVRVDEFLFQLSRGHRDDTILQDAVSRLDDDSATTKAVIQFISGALDEKGFDAALSTSHSEGARCSAYFDAMWYAKLRNEDAMAQRYHQHLVEIGKFHCGQHLVYAQKYKF